MNGGVHEPRNVSFAESQQLHVAALLKRNICPLWVDWKARLKPAVKTTDILALMKHVVNYIADHPANPVFHRLI